MKLQSFFDRGNNFFCDESHRIDGSKKSSAFKRTPNVIVIHWSAGAYSTDEKRLQRIKQWVADPNEKKSVHFCILRGGAVYQLVGLDRAAWHAGKSEWIDAQGNKLSSLNYYSFGIELDLVGPVTQKNGKWVDSYGHAFLGAVAQGEDGKFYEQPSDQMLYSLRMVIDTLRSKYQIALQDVVGHVDVSPGRKIDPGPLVTRVSLGLSDG